MIQHPTYTTAYLDGWHAHRLGTKVNYNPYDVATQPVSHRQWLCGWSQRFSAVKHGRETRVTDELVGDEQ